MAFPNHPLIAPHRTSRDEVLAFQEAQLRKVVAHAYEHVPYYRRLFDDQGVKPGDVRTPADLCLLPITDRRTIQGLPLDERLARGTVGSAMATRPAGTRRRRARDGGGPVPLGAARPETGAAPDRREPGSRPPARRGRGGLFPRRRGGRGL